MVSLELSGKLYVQIRCVIFLVVLYYFEKVNENYFSLVYFKRNFIQEIKVAQLAGSVAELSAYHGDVFFEHKDAIRILFDRSATLLPNSDICS